MVVLDLSTVKEAVATVLAAESRLDVLVNNTVLECAARPAPTDEDQLDSIVQDVFPPKDHQAFSGQDIPVATNRPCPYLLHQLSAPLLAKTAAKSPLESVRVPWTGSSGVDHSSPKPGRTEVGATGQPTDCGVRAGFGQRIVGNRVFACSGARHMPTMKGGASRFQSWECRDGVATPRKCFGRIGDRERSRTGSLHDSRVA